MVRGFIVYPTYRIIDGKAYVWLFGRLENGESFQTSTLFRPYFFIRTVDLSKAKGIAPGVEYWETGMKNFDEESVTKVLLNVPKEVPQLKDLFLRAAIPCYEADIRFTMRFLIDLDLKGTLNIEGQYTKDKFVDRFYEEPVLSSIPAEEYFPKLKVLCIDIETDAEAQQIYSIGMYREDFGKVYLAKPGTYEQAECFPDEKSMLEAFAQFIRKDDPDILLGWNFIDFDLKILKERFAQYNIPFLLGRTDDPCTLRLIDSFFQDSSADFPGRIVFDGIHLARMSFLRLPDYKLNTAAKEILGEEKLLKNTNNVEEISRLWREDPGHLVKYNLKDAELEFRVIEKANLLALTIRRSMLTRMPLDRVNASIASLDSLYLKELQKRGLIAPSVQGSDRDERIKGGYVMESRPGIYDNIIVLDFKSLYPSVIRTFNIDPQMYVPPKKVALFKPEVLITAPNGAHFRRDEGILSKLIHSLWQQRDEAKKQNDALASNAIKILMNSFFGVLANPMCRFYSLEMGNAITHFGQFLIKTTAERVRKTGYEVIYGDTDSIFVDTHLQNYQEAVQKAHELAEFLNSFMTAFVSKHFNCKSYLELEFDKVFKKFVLPTVRGSEEGAKKRYAGIVEEDGKDSLVFTGMEFVRRDWTGVSKKFQLELFERVFTNADITLYIKQFVQDLRMGKYDELLVYRKGIRKGVEQYTKTTPPHIQAARKLGRTRTGVIEYIMTLEGPEPLEQRRHAIDYAHYIDKQLKPIADSILGLFGKNFDDLLAGHKQATLGDF